MTWLRFFPRISGFFAGRRIFSRENRDEPGDWPDSSQRRRLASQAEWRFKIKQAEQVLPGLFYLL
jgi:hypothetical protein